MQRVRSLPVVLLAVAFSLAPVAASAAEDVWEAGDVEAAERYRELEQERARRFREETARRAEAPRSAAPAPAPARTPARERPPVVAEEPAEGRRLPGWPRRLVDRVMAFADGLRERADAGPADGIRERLEEDARDVVSSVVAWVGNEMLPALGDFLRDELVFLPEREPEAADRESLRADLSEPVVRPEPQPGELARRGGPADRTRRNHAMRVLQPFAPSDERVARRRDRRDELARAREVDLAAGLSADLSADRAADRGAGLAADRAADLEAEWEELGRAAAADAVEASRWWQEEALRRFGRRAEREAR